MEEFLKLLPRASSWAEQPLPLYHSDPDRETHKMSKPAISKLYYAPPKYLLPSKTDYLELAAEVIKRLKEREEEQETLVIASPQLLPNFPLLNCPRYTSLYPAVHREADVVRESGEIIDWVRMILE